MTNSNNNTLQLGMHAIGMLIFIGSLIFAYTMLKPGVSVTNLSEKMFSELPQKQLKHTDGKNIFVIQYRGGFSVNASEKFATEVMTAVGLSQKGDWLLLNVESSGGDGAACSHSYEQVMRAKDAGMKVMAITDYRALSCGYMLLSSADVIMAAPGASIGNIGAVITGGNNPNVVGSTDTKAYLAGGKMTEQARQNIYTMLQRSKQHFVDNVMATRKDKIREITKDLVFSGMVFNGKDSVKLGLVDAIGDFRQQLSTSHLAGYTVHMVEYKDLISRYLN